MWCIMSLSMQAHDSWLNVFSVSSLSKCLNRINKCYYVHLCINRTFFSHFLGWWTQTELVFVCLSSSASIQNIIFQHDHLCHSSKFASPMQACITRVTMSGFSVYSNDSCKFYFWQCKWSWTINTEPKVPWRQSVVNCNTEQQWLCRL